MREYDSHLASFYYFQILLSWSLALGINGVLTDMAKLMVGAYTLFNYLCQRGPFSVIIFTQCSGRRWVVLDEENTCVVNQLVINFSSVII